MYGCPHTPWYYRPIPRCLEFELEQFIEGEMEKQQQKWTEDKRRSLDHLPECQKQFDQCSPQHLTKCFYGWLQEHNKTVATDEDEDYVEVLTLNTRKRVKRETL